MNYGKSGGAKPGRNEPYSEQAKPPSKTAAPDGRPTKAELLARMKAAAAKSV